MKTVKLIALDLDGTIIREDQTISDEDRAAIARAGRAGVAVVIATGRIFPTAQDWISRLNITTPVICCNGADIREGGKSIFTMPIKTDQLEKAYLAMDKFDVKRFVFCGDHIYCTKGTYHEDLFRKWGPERVAAGMIAYCDDLSGILKAVNGNAVKFLVCTPNQDEHAAILEEVNSFKCFDVVKGEALHFELTQKGVSKGLALRELAQIMGVDIRDTVAIGDSTNDYEMIRAAGVGIAMGNAMPDLLKVADDITLPIRQNGVAHAINKYVFGEENKGVSAILSPV